MKGLAFLLLVFLAGAQPAGEAGFAHWSAAQLKGFEATLAARMDPVSKTASQDLGRWGKYWAMISRRSADGQPEVHETATDFFVVEGGEATLVVGGRLVGAKTVGAGELRGTSIEGGARRQLRAGDIVHIPQGTPHQLLVAEKFLYYVIKVDNSR